MKLFGSLRVPSLLAKIDQKRLREIQCRYASSTNVYVKYADAGRWLKRNIPRIRKLQLDRSRPKEILDLGFAVGFFLFIARQFSHSGRGAEIDGEFVWWKPKPAV